MSKLVVALSGAVSVAALATGLAQAQDAPIQLEEITVEGRGAGAARVEGAAGVATSDGYVAKTTRSATKTDTPVNEIPATVNTVTQKQLEDRRPESLEDALAYTPGVRVGAYGFDPRFDSFTIRGVDVTYTGVFRDGLRQQNSPSGLFRLEPYGLESISILKGPASAIYGASASVGIIDLVSKRPTDYKFAEVEAQTGSFDRLQGSFDLGGPANDDGTVLWRLTGLARHANTELVGIPDDRLFLAPAVTFKPSDATKITLLGEYMNATTGGSAAYENTYGEYTLKNGTTIPVTTGVGENILFNPDFNTFNQKQARIGYEFEHAFNDAVSLHQNVRFSTLSTSEKFAGATYAGLVKEEVDGLSTDTYLKTKLTTGPVEHTVLTGVDFGRLKYDSQIGYNFTDVSTPDLPDPVRQRQTLVGVYVQDELKAGPWRLLLGGRHDWLDSTYVDPANPAQDGDQKEGAFSGRAGLSYVTAFGLTPYVSYGTSFNANSGTVIDPDGPAGPLSGGVAKPTRGEQAEAGVKYAVPGYNASVNASLFWLKQEDGIVYEVVDDLNRQTQLDFRSQGFEIEAAASLTNGVNLLASYSFTDTKILKLTEDTEGKDVNSVPKHAFTIWGGYDVQSGALEGLGLGAGVRYSGSSFGDNYNRSIIKNEARAFVDARASYDFEKLSPQLKGVRLQVNAFNLFNKVEQVCTAGYCYLDEGRRVTASLKYRW